MYKFEYTRVPGSKGVMLYALGVDGLGYSHLAYVTGLLGSNDQTITYAYNDREGWHQDPPLESGLNFGNVWQFGMPVFFALDYLSLQVARDESIYLSYVKPDPSTHSEIWLAKRDPGADGTWRRKQIGTGWGGISLALDWVDFPHVLYASRRGKIVYAHPDSPLDPSSPVSQTEQQWDEAEWHEEEIFDGGGTTSLWLRAGNRPYFAFEGFDNTVNAAHQLDDPVYYGEWLYREVCPPGPPALEHQYLGYYPSFCIEPSEGCGDPGQRRKIQHLVYNEDRLVNHPPVTYLVYAQWCHTSISEISMLDLDEIGTPLTAINYRIGRPRIKLGDSHGPYICYVRFREGSRQICYAEHDSEKTFEIQVVDGGLTKEERPDMAIYLPGHRGFNFAEMPFIAYLNNDEEIVIAQPSFSRTEVIDVRLAPELPRALEWTIHNTGTESARVAPVAMFYREQDDTTTALGRGAAARSAYDEGGSEVPVTVMNELGWFDAAPGQIYTAYSDEIVPLAAEWALYNTWYSSSTEIGMNSRYSFCVPQWTQLR